MPERTDGTIFWNQALNRRYNVIYSKDKVHIVNEYFGQITKGRASYGVLVDEAVDDSTVRLIVPPILKIKSPSGEEIRIVNTEGALKENFLPLIKSLGLNYGETKIGWFKPKIRCIVVPFPAPGSLYIMSTGIQDNVYDLVKLLNIFDIELRPMVF